ELAPPGIASAPPRIRRFSGQSSSRTGAAPASVDRALASPGTPLEPALRQDMEQRFGRDFSWVRVHSGAAAEQSARDVNAHAYTVGYDIAFGAGQYAPATRDGRRLLAHELAHVVQQPQIIASNGHAYSSLIQMPDACISPWTIGAITAARRAPAELAAGTAPRAMRTDSISTCGANPEIRIGCSDCETQP